MTIADLPGTSHDLTGISIRPASFADAPFLVGLVGHLGGNLPRIGHVDVDDPYAVVDALWHRAAAVFVAGSADVEFAIVTIYDLDLLHRTAWVEAHHPADVPDQVVAEALWSAIEHGRRAWNLRTIRTMDPVTEVPLFAAFGELARFEGEIPGGCPGNEPATAAVRAIDLEVSHVD